jgi:hypothetical protein
MRAIYSRPSVFLLSTSRLWLRAGSFPTLETKRLKDFHFTVEEGANDSWPVFSWGMSAALA